MFQGCVGPRQISEPTDGVVTFTWDAVRRVSMRWGWVGLYPWTQNRIAMDWAHRSGLEHAEEEETIQVFFHVTANHPGGVLGELTQVRVFAEGLQG